MSVNNSAPGAEGSLERFIVKCALTLWPVRVRPSFISPCKCTQPVAEVRILYLCKPARSPAQNSAVFRCLEDYVTHPDVPGLDFSMRNAIWRCSVATHTSNLIFEAALCAAVSGCTAHTHPQHGPASVAI